MSMDMTWKQDPIHNRKCFVRMLSALVKKDWYSTLEWIEKRKLEGSPGVDLDGMIDMRLSQYAYNIEWASRRQIKSIKQDVLNTAYSYARIDTKLGLKDHTAFMQWIETKLAEL